MRRSWIVGLLLLVGMADAQADTVGQATSIKNEVTGELSSVVSKVPTGGIVSSDEVLRTGAGSAAMLRFLDQSNLNIGAMSTVRLDDFVFNPDQTAQSRIVSLTTGAMRFVSGGGEPKGVAISTPVATISIRGTDIVVVCDVAVKCAILLQDGSISVCPWPITQKLPENCPDAYQLNTAQNFTVVGENGQNLGALRIDPVTLASLVRSIADGGSVLPPDVLAGLAGGGGPGLGGGFGGGLGAGILGAGIGVFIIHNADRPVSP